MRSPPAAARSRTRGWRTPTQLPADAPLRLVINTRKKPAFAPGVALALDWTHRFDGRLTHPPGSWQEHLIPALEAVAQAIAEHAPGRRIVAEGLCALPAAVAFGTVFLATRGMSVGWRQISPNREPELWSLGTRPEPCGFAYQVGDGDPSADDFVGGRTCPSCARSWSYTGRALTHMTLQPRDKLGTWCGSSSRRCATRGISTSPAARCTYFSPYRQGWPC